MSRAQRCPTPYKKAFSDKGEALLVAASLRQRTKRGRSKQKWDPVAPYKCRCGRVHLASADRVRVMK